MPLLTLPLALLGLAALPAVVAIYLLRNRLKRQEVSSLHLWMGQREAHDGGQRVQKAQLPWLLILEILALILLVLAATDPRILMGEQQRQLVVVLDDSYSMQAGGKELAQKHLMKLVESEDPLSVRLVLAREEPTALSTQLTQPAQVLEALEGWRCQSMTADLELAIGLAYELSGERGRVLVLTDHQPLRNIQEPRLVWKALGEAKPNVAIINAVRTGEDSQQQRVLVEIANYSTDPATTVLRMNEASSSLELSPGELRRLWVEIEDPTAALAISLQDDPLTADNQVLLLPPKRSVVRVQLEVANPVLLRMLERAVEVSGNGRIVTERGDLLLTDQQESTLSSPTRWMVHWTADEDAAAFVGPFIKDENHPLIDGLELGSVVWGAGQDAQMPGRVVLAAGNTSLISVVDRSGVRGAHYEVFVRINPQRSTVVSTPAFPVLIWNLLAWRQQSLPGLSQTNVRLGSQVTFTPWRADGLEEPSEDAPATGTPATPATDDASAKVPLEVVKIYSPDGKSREVTVHGQSVVVAAEQPGVYELTAGTRKYELAVNALSPQESDLASLASSTIGSWETTATLRTQYTSIAWMLILGTLGVLTAHSFITWRSAGGTR